MSENKLTLSEVAENMERAAEIIDILSSQRHPHGAQCGEVQVEADPRIESDSAEDIAQWLYANGYHKAASTVRGQLDIRNARIRQLEAERAAVPDGWILTADRLPDVAEGRDAFYWIAIKRASGKVHTFPAVYANRYPLCCSYDNPSDASGPGWSQVVLDENGDGDIAVTGWYDIKSDSEYDSLYIPVCEKGDEVIAWHDAPTFAATSLAGKEKG